MFSLYLVFGVFVTLIPFIYSLKYAEKDENDGNEEATASVGCREKEQASQQYVVSQQQA